MLLIKYIRDAINIIFSHNSNRGIVFYSEGESSWPFLRGPCFRLQDSNLNLSYLTSDSTDPGLTELTGNFSVFLTDSNWIRNWIFENLNCRLLVMTTPDLNQYQLKRSKYNVHYIYIQHSLSSLHMIYRKGAFDHFDTIFCSGPHHVREVKALEKINNTKTKSIVEHGYPVIDELLQMKHRQANPRHKKSYSDICVLIAPSWGPEGLIESGAAYFIITRLLAHQYKVILRPHPETIKRSKIMIERIEQTHGRESNFDLELNCKDRISFLEADIMISDWSGAAFEYALGFKKQIIWINTAKKVNNPEYLDVPFQPFEEWFRNLYGYQLELNQLDTVSSLIKQILEASTPQIVTNQIIFNIGQSDVKAADALHLIYNEVRDAE